MLHSLIYCILFIIACCGFGAYFALKIRIRNLKRKENASAQSDTSTSDPESHIPAILLIDRNPDIAKQLKKILGDKIHISTAGDLATAYTINKEEDFDIVLGDVIIAADDGKESIGTLIESRIEEEKINEEKLKNQLVFDLKDFGLESSDKRFMRRALECINRNLDIANFDVSQFAKQMGTSKSTLYNRMKALTGMSPNNFIRHVRFQASCQIMQKHPEIRISELAYCVGFNDPKYFSLSFRREFGKSPSEYCEQFLQPTLNSST